METKAYTIANLSEKGHGLVSTKPLKENDILFCEKPLLCCQFAWNRFYGYKCCDYCLQPLETPKNNARRLLKDSSFVLPHVPGLSIPSADLPIFACPSCGTEYCSEACRAASADEYHTFTCCSGEDNPFYKLEELWRECHPPPETGTVMLLVRIAAAHFSAHFKHCARAQHIVHSLHRFVSSPIVEIPNGDAEGPGSSSLTLTHRMLRPQFSGDLARLHGLFLEVLSNMAQRTGVSSPSAVSDLLQSVGLGQLVLQYGFCSALCLIGRNGQGIGTSPLGAWGKAAQQIVEDRGDPNEIQKFSDFLDDLYDRLDQSAGEFLDNEGVGLYELQSLMNHSCFPNTSVHFQSGTNELSIVVEHDVDTPGTELTISYLDECMLMRSGHSRRKYLRDHYLFLCKCQRCLGEKERGEESATSEEEEDCCDDSMDAE